jgi:hypothetical protein
MSAARPRAPRRSRSSLHLLGASLMILVGAFLPWISTGAGNVIGVRGAGLWTMYAAFLGLGGAFIRHRRVASAHAGILAVVATVLPVWQLLHMLSRVGFAGWMPGAGLVLTLGGGVLAGFSAVALWRESRALRSGS